MSGLELGLLLAGALLIALMALGAFTLGVRFARRITPGSLREVERALGELAEGRHQVMLDVPDDDPGAGVARATRALARALADRLARLERRVGRLAAAVDELPGRGLLVVDRDLLVLAAGASAARALEKSSSEIEGESLARLFEPEAARALVAELALARSGGESVRARVPLASDPSHAASVEARWIEPERERLAVLVAAAPERAQDPAELVSRYAGILEGLPAGIALVVEGRVVEANPSARRLLGERPVGVELAEVIAVEDLLLVRDRIARAEAGETPPHFSCRLLPPSEGERAREVEVSARPVRYGEQQGAALTMIDRAEERSARRRARVQEARLLAVFDAVVDGLVLLSAPSAGATSGRWRVGLLNEGVKRLLDIDGSEALGASEDEFRGLVAHRFARPDELVAFLEEARDNPRREHQQIFDLGEEEGRTVELIVRPVLDEEHVVIGRILLVRDITRHRSSERRLRADAASLESSRESLQHSYEELVKLHRDLESKSDEMERLNRELTELDRARTQLVGDLSHELQTPLVSIRGYNQMLLDGRLGRINEEQKKGLEASLRSVDRMVELISNLLSVARLEGAPAPRAGVVDVAGVIEDAVTRLEGMARQKGLSLEARIESPGLELEAEPDALRQVVDNLLSNAIKFTPSGGRVLVMMKGGPRGYATIEVRDSGVGIEREELKRIYERFYRGRRAEGLPGSGIGLATVRSILERHGASIQCASEVGRGTTFRVRWPLAGSAAERGATPTQTSRS